MFEADYYNQPLLWRSQAEPYQVQLLADILSLIPQGTQSILDVGCGNGLITNALPKNIQIVGLDSSQEALKSVHHETVVGSISDLPFDDASFDFVMANDVIEHLSDEIYFQAISELFRVSSKYVLISVPHGEQLEASFTECADCGARYHINHHQRSLLEHDLVEICPSSWNVNEIRYSGDITRYPLDEQYASLLRNLQINNVDCNNFICPYCGSSQIVKSTFNKSNKIIGYLRSKAFFENRSNFVNRHIDRSEIIALYTKQHIGGDSQNSKWISLERPQEIQQSPLLLDISNPLQQVEQGFVEGCFWPKYLDKLKSNLSFPDSSTDITQDILICFPVILQPGDKIVVRTQEPILKSTSIKVFFYDEIDDCSLSTTDGTLKTANEIEYTVSTNFKSSLYGTPIGIQATGEVAVKTVEYFSVSNKERENFSSNFIRIQANHNIVVSDQKKYYRSWGLLSDSSGYYPKPEWLWQEDLRTCCEVDSNLSIHDYIEVVKLAIQTEKKTATAALKRLNTLLENRSASVSRVLVLSHMFPHETQPNSGCFIAEQVAALREKRGLEVRVVSCQPFWIESKNPIEIIKRIKAYKKALSLSSWSTWGNIPVLRIPYLVGRPFFPFPMHGFTYRYAVSEWANRIRQKFNFDLVHAHTSYLDGFTGSFLARKYQVPFVITEHTGPFSILADRSIVRQVTAYALKSADKIISVSPSLENEVKKILAPSHHQKMTCIPNGVDTDIFYPKQKQNNNNDSYLMLLSVMSLDENKNPFCLLEAFRLLHEQGIKIKLNIVGIGELEQQLQRWIKDNNLMEFIQLLGFQTRHEVARLMREDCDIFVLSSHSETFGVVVIEALASGKPVVSTRCGGPQSVIVEPYLGELCDNDNFESLASAIKKVASNLSSYDAQKIRDFILKKYDFSVIQKNINNVYQNL
ncbi:glycosyltransferase [[Limnothrix rosea] IAM M-220]|uniref:glycosyltransferase n=1 Tax=[Limnothrix rosea] IAM M-220 TaxID=454133 RepID=UPI00096369FA|nr:glycosyltransferase [[Limnothrix rosea] IAM M-220]OKH18856.1 hypothetical protein NIES208_03830 [[Limnothrix rosea] IAM M-220]